MTPEAISPLRRRMIEDMTVRNFAWDTQRNYIRAVKNLTVFLGRSPDTATAEDLRLFQLHLTSTGVRPPTINGTVTALRFFFSVTVDQVGVTKPLTFVAEPRKIPIVLSPEEVARFLEAAPGAKYKAALSAAYGAGPVRHLIRSAQIAIEHTAPSRLTFPRVPSLEVCGRRPTSASQASVTGRHPQTFTRPDFADMRTPAAYSGRPAARSASPSFDASAGAVNAGELAAQAEGRLQFQNAGRGGFRLVAPIQRDQRTAVEGLSASAASNAAKAGGRSCASMARQKPARVSASASSRPCSRARRA